MASQGPLAGRRFLVTGIADASSLALAVALELQAQGGELVATALGPTPHHGDLSERAHRYLEDARESAAKTVSQHLGDDVPLLTCDVGIDASLDELGAALRERELAVDGVVHAVAMDRTLRRGRSSRLLDTSREDFLSCMDVSAWSLIGLTRALMEAEALRAGASLVALSYIGAERVVSHPYKNVAVAKAALERIVVELAAELGPEHGVRVNALRFSPYTASRAGGAIPGLAEAEERAARESPLGNALPRHLALEVAHLMQPGLAVTGEIRHVDGGQHVRI